MYKAFKFQLNPDQQQTTAINQQLGCSRFVYNWALNEKSKYYAEHKKSLSVFELMLKLTELKKELIWLADVQAQALQMSLRNLETAYTNFFHKRAGFPKFKSKKNSRQSFQYPQNVKLKDNQIYLPKIGWCHFYKHREIQGTIKTVTVSSTPTGKYFASILCDNSLAVPTKKPIHESTSVGLDLGIKSLAVTSDNKMFENQKHFKKMSARLRVEQRKLLRKFKPGGVSQSRGYFKQKLAVAKVYEQITNQRLDNLHKVTTFLVRNYNTICIEDLNVAGMVKNPKLAKHIQDCGWSMLRQMLTYKCEERGKNLIVINRFEPSSKRCNSCGHINTIKLSDREFNCQSCNVLIDRDYNAAKNIRDYGLGVKPSDAKVNR